MQFPFDISQLFPERITILDHTLVAGRKSAGRPDLQENIATVLDELGRASAKAQQLTAPITSASKLQVQKHQLYLMKDGEGSGGRGAVVGFLKVGYKKLFLLDRHGVHVEAEPLCILDFYICENMQRHGYGLELFNFMLQHKHVEPVLMAYDRPSPKLLSFLAKHYSLTQSIPQVNNFVVFEGFFLNKSAGQLRKTPLRKPEGEIKPYSLMEREVVRQEQRVPPWPFAPPQSPQRWVSSPYSQSPSSSPSRAPRGGAPGGYSPQSPLLEHCRTRRTSLQGLVAKSSLYSRHLDQRSVALLERPPPGLRTPWAQFGTSESLRSDCVLSAQNRFTTLPPIPAPKSSDPNQTSISSKHSTTPSSEEDIRPTQDQGQAQDPDQNPDQSPDQSRQTLRPHMAQKPVPVIGPSQRRGDSEWTWTVGQNVFTAQWVKHKQQHRSTRPW
ncbi:hypothetical protein NQD34_008674 [Periophthalmus magnuspinnatus]|nr:hypothetical protein NQD34_008674 [Periophthalmus magnuspinnatus]